MHFIPRLIIIADKLRTTAHQFEQNSQSLSFQSFICYFFDMGKTEETKPGKLYVVATPIGNLEDITLRAIRILKEVDLIAAEDTRHTRKLLHHLNIHTRLISYYRENEMERGKELIKRIEAGESVALVTDAGSPGISDPGGVIVRMARNAGLHVTPIPGPSAITAAISVAGLPHSSFLFLGFPPAKKQQRRKLLQSLKNSIHPLIFYESVHRFQHLLADSLLILGDRQAFMAREITKSYEELVGLTLSELFDAYQHTMNKKGEFVLIIHPGKPTEAEGENIEELVVWYRDNTDLTLKDVSKKLSTDLGLSRSQVYQKALRLWKKKNQHK